MSPTMPPGLERGYLVRGLGATYDEGHRVHADTWPEAEELAKAKRAEGLREVRIQPLDFRERDNQMCTCGHLCMGHGSFDGDHEFVGIGQGDCTHCWESFHAGLLQGRDPCMGFRWSGVTWW